MKHIKKHNAGLIEIFCGAGKCLALGTKVMLANGEVTKVENINYEHLTFLATYVVPLISFDFGSGRQMIVLFLLLVVMGIIYIKTDLFYANPSLALLGFHIYRANGSFKNGDREGIVLVARGRIKEGQKLSYIKLDEKIYYVKGG